MTFEEKQLVLALVCTPKPPRKPRGERVPKRKCCKCGKTYTIQKHHVTYEPEKIVKLCKQCHSIITVINTIGSIATGTKKNSKVRLRLWEWFIQESFAGVQLDSVVAVLGVTHEFNARELGFIYESRSRIDYGRRS